MNPSEASALLAPANPGHGGTWADLGAGEGVFTLALAELLGAGARIYAVDRDRRALSSLEGWTPRVAAKVTPVLADFTRVFDLPGASAGSLDGMLLANALHYVRDADVVLRKLAPWLRPGGRLIVVEYDWRTANPWVPHPVSPARLRTLLAETGFSEPVITGTRPSEFGGQIYVAATERL